MAGSAQSRKEVGGAGGRVRPGQVIHLGPPGLSLSPHSDWSGWLSGTDWAGGRCGQQAVDGSLGLDQVGAGAAPTGAPLPLQIEAKQQQVAEAQELRKARADQQVR